jgi:hypothetical protein
LPSKFVRPPIEFRRLYGPNIRQTLIDNFVVSGFKTEVLVVKPSVKKLKQKKIHDYFA